MPTPQEGAQPGSLAWFLRSLADVPDGDAVAADGLTDLVVPLWWSAGDRSPADRLELIHAYDPDRRVPAVGA